MPVCSKVKDVLNIIIPSTTSRSPRASWNSNCDCLEQNPLYWTSMFMYISKCFFFYFFIFYFALLEGHVLFSCADFWFWFHLRRRNGCSLPQLSWRRTFVYEGKSWEPQDPCQVSCFFTGGSACLKYKRELNGKPDVMHSQRIQGQVSQPGL